MALEALDLTLTQKLPLKHVRAQLGLSQPQLARRAGVHRMTIGNAEHGKTIYLETAYKILRALNAERHHQMRPRLALHDLDWDVKE